MSDDSDLERTCTAQQPNGRFCDRPSVPLAPFPICFRHAGAVLDFMRTVYERSALTGDDLSIMLKLADKLPDVRPASGPRRTRHRVYYVRMGDRIKIGTSISVHKRMRSYPPNAELLATEPGGYDVEARRLAQFAPHLADRKEWFHPAPELMAHIDSLRTAA